MADKNPKKKLKARKPAPKVEAVEPVTARGKAKSPAKKGALH